MSTSVSSSFASYVARATIPHMDRRGIAERRVKTKAKPLAESAPSWGRHVFGAGLLGVVLGSAGSIAVIAQRAASSPELTADLVRVEQPVTAAAVAVPAFAATPVASAVEAATASSAIAGPTGLAAGAAKVEATVEAGAGAGSYSEDAAGVPGATYREPPVIQPGPPRMTGTIAR